MLLSRILQIMGSHSETNTTEVEQVFLRYSHEDDSYIFDTFSVINFDISLNSELLDNVNLDEIVLSMYLPTGFFNRTNKTDIKCTSEQLFFLKNTAKDDLSDDFPGIPCNTNQRPILSLLVANKYWSKNEIINSEKYFEKAGLKIQEQKQKAALCIEKGIRYTKTHYPQSPILNGTISLLEDLLEIINDESGYHNIFLAIDHRFDSFENHLKQTNWLNEESRADLKFTHECYIESLYSFICSINEYHRIRKIYLNKQRLLTTLELTEELNRPGVSFKIKLKSKQGNTDIVLASKRTTLTKLRKKFRKTQYKKLITRN